MDIKQQSQEKEKNGTSRKVMTALIVLVVFAALALAARYLVSNIDFVELIKRIHGG
jgi:hypothetical protein